MKNYWKICCCFFLVSACGMFKARKSDAIFIDEFNALNRRRWSLQSHSFQNNQANFNPANAKTSEGMLTLFINAANKKEKAFSAAEIRSRRTFHYGKFSARMKAAKGDGVVSSFFLYDDASSQDNQEIDIEFTGKNTSIIHFNYWLNGQGHLKSIALPFDAAEEFHEYTIMWQAGQLSWAVDGKELYRVTGTVPGRPMKVTANIWPSKPNDWAGEFDPKVLPCAAQFEQISVYTRKRD